MFILQELVVLYLHGLFQVCLVFLIVLCLLFRICLVFPFLSWICNNLNVILVFFLPSRICVLSLHVLAFDVIALRLLGLQTIAILFICVLLQHRVALSTIHPDKPRPT